MKQKIIVSLLLLVSACCLLQPSFKAVIDLEKTISEYSNVPREFLESRDSLRYQIIGHVLLYICLFTIVWITMPAKELRPQKKEEEASKPKVEHEIEIPLTVIICIAITIIIIVICFFWVWLPLLT